MTLALSSLLIRQPKTVIFWIRVVFSTYSNILGLSIIPGMSDHEAVAFHVNIVYKPTQTNLEHNTK